MCHLLPIQVSFASSQQSEAVCVLTMCYNWCFARFWFLLFLNYVPSFSNINIFLENVHLTIYAPPIFSFDIIYRLNIQSIKLVILSSLCSTMIRGFMLLLKTFINLSQIQFTIRSLTVQDMYYELIVEYAR
jgi:hypothetical protein